jgi:hypothetical protein
VIHEFEIGRVYINRRGDLRKVVDVMLGGLVMYSYVRDNGNGYPTEETRSCSRATFARWLNGKPGSDWCVRRRE